MGTKWMIESTVSGHAEWLTNNLKWTSDPHACMQFDTKDDAIEYRDNHIIVAEVTEHIFMSPVSIPKNQN